MEQNQINYETEQVKKDYPVAVNDWQDTSKLPLISVIISGLTLIVTIIILIITLMSPMGRPIGRIGGEEMFRNGERPNFEMNENSFPLDN